MGKRRGEDLRKGRLNSSNNAKRKFQLSSDDDVDEVVGRKFKGGGGSIGEFLSEEDEAEEESGDEDEGIVNKSRSALFGQQNGLPATTRPPSSSGGSDSYLSDTRCVCVFIYNNIIKVPF